MAATGRPFGARRHAIKKLSLLLLAATFAALPWAAKAQDVATGSIGPFGGLNNADSSVIIPANKAQDLLNVDVTPGGRSVKKRRGYGLSTTLSITTSAVHGVYTFYDASGNTVDLFFNDREISASVNGGSASVLNSTGTNGATYQCVDSQGYAYCANTARTPIIKTNGVTATQVVASSTGTLVAVTQERLVNSGFSEAPNRVDFSKANDFTTWTVGAQDTDPVQFTIVSPGSHITHIVYAFGRIIWFKDTSFGYILEGETQADWQVRVISPNLGTLDNTSVYREGILYFRGNDGHIYGYDGSNYTKLTRDLQGTISTSQSRISNSWAQSTQAEWLDGSFDTTLYLDTETAPGTIQTTFPDNFTSTFRTSGSGAKDVWTASSSGHANAHVRITSNQLEMRYADDGGLTGNSGLVRSTSRLGRINSTGTTYYFQLAAVDSFPTFTSSAFFEFCLSQNQLSVPNGCGGASTEYGVRFNNNGGTVGVTDSVGGVISSSRTVTLPALVAVWITSTTLQVTVGGTVVGSGSHNFYSNGMNQPYVNFTYNAAGASTNYYGAAIDSFTVTGETFTYTSPVHNAPSLTSWDTFSANSASNGGTITFSLRSSTNSFSASSSTPSYSSVTPGAVISVSTGTYFQNKIVVNLSDFGSAPLSVSDFTDNWFEGFATDKSYATYFKDALWWSVTTGTGATTNNRVLRYDFLNGDWYLYDIPTNGMLVRNNSLYFGSTSGGYIYKFGDVDNDAGAAINAYWRSKDFFGDSPFVDKELVNLSLAGLSVANSSATVTYTLNGENSTSFTMSLYDPNKAIVRLNKSLPLGKIGNTFRVQFGNNATDQPFEIYAVQYGLREKPWVPSQ